MPVNNSNLPGDAQLRPGDTIGPYVIERTLGSGGMADVYYAVHSELARPAAIKVLKASLATDEVHLQRFLQEARAAAALIHPNIVQVYDVGREGNHRYIAQEYIPGSNLRQLLAQPKLATTTESKQVGETEIPAPQTSTNGDVPMGLRETLSIFVQVLAALTKSASSRIVHRDIKPENIMLTVDGEAKVADFGLARVLLGDDPQLTRAGTTLGTPMYMSPEQIQDGEVDIRSDLYSLGVTVFHMLAGRPPYKGETPLALAMQHVQAEVPDIRQFRQDLPDSIVHMLHRMLAKSPAERFSSPQELVQYLRDHRGGDLAPYWPEQTVPLPGAISAGSTGPLRATMMLQSRLRKKKLNHRLWGMALAGTFMLAGLAFAAGRAAGTKPDPFEVGVVDEVAAIPQQATVEEQFLYALFAQEDDQSQARWLAVEHYFPGPNELNRQYAVRAQLQLAGTYARAGDTSSAQGILQKILSDESLLFQALANLQLAELAQSDQDAHRRLAAAKEIYSKQNFGESNRGAVDAYIASSPILIELWETNSSTSS